MSTRHHPLYKYYIVILFYYYNILIIILHNINMIMIIKNKLLDFNSLFLGLFRFVWT